LKGRVLRENPIDTTSYGTWDTFKKNIQRINSKEVAGVKLQITYNQSIVVCHTDEEGYFETQINDTNWATPTIEVLAVPFKISALHLSVGNIIRSEDKEIGIISDIDDTILVTDSHTPTKMLRTTLLKHATQRKILVGIDEWYKELKQGTNKSLNRPFFYVSSSPWTLYEVIHHIFRHNNLPMGAMILRDYGVDKHQMIIGTHSDHKRTTIDRILATFPNMQFILSGDTAQQDAFIYYQVAIDYPNRILAIYIRDVGLPQKRQAVEPIVHTATKQGIEILLFKDTKIAQNHSRSKGWI
jgi:phosphatidate phosphatase APP1